MGKWLFFLAISASFGNGHLTVTLTLDLTIHTSLLLLFEFESISLSDLVVTTTTTTKYCESITVLEYWSIGIKPGKKQEKFFLMCIGAFIAIIHLHVDIYLHTRTHTYTRTHARTLTRTATGTNQKHWTYNQHWTHDMRFDFNRKKISFFSRPNPPPLLNLKSRFWKHLPHKDALFYTEHMQRRPPPHMHASRREAEHWKVFRVADQGAEWGTSSGIFNTDDVTNQTQARRNWTAPHRQTIPTTHMY